MEGQSNEILEQIFMQLENVSDMEKCSKTCRKWNQIIESEWINKKLISCPFDGCSAKVNKFMWRNMEDHKMYCIFDPKFLNLLEGFNGNIHFHENVKDPDLRNLLVHKL